MTYPPPPLDRFQRAGTIVPGGEPAYRCECGLICAGPDAMRDHHEWHLDRGDYRAERP
jgi:hypothetical protein